MVAFYISSMDKKRKNTFNDKGYLHGYTEVYNSMGDKLEFKGNVKNGDPWGYVEVHVYESCKFFIR
jgi:hypothetical protein